MKVYYGWTKLNKVKKHEAISVIYENCFVPKAEREKIREALKREFLATHKHYREYGYQLSLEL